MKKDNKLNVKLNELENNILDTFNFIQNYQYNTDKKILVRSN